MKNNKLAIAIPTYQRASILRENILVMFEEIKRYSIPIYVSDDSIDDDTESVIDELKKEYDYVFYHKNHPSLGHDKNCLRTLSLPTEEYIWYLGDSIIIKEGGIKKVLELVDDNKYDFISLNSKNRNVNVASTVYFEGNKLMTEIGWHLTMTSATIYYNRIQKMIPNLDIVKCKNFPQTALIFESFANGNFKLYWLNESLIYGNLNKKSYWSHAVFDVFLTDWDFFISNLPDFYSDKSKKHIIRTHSQKTGLFTFMRFLDYRSNGVYSFSVLKKYYKQIHFNSNVNLVLLALISILPKSILNFLKSIFYPENK